MTTNTFILIVAAASFCLVSSMVIDDNTIDDTSDSVMLIDTLQEYYNTHSPDVPGKSNKCACGGYSCNCCFTVRILKKQYTICTQVGFIPLQTAVTIKVTINGRTIINQKVSAQNPPALCVGVPYISRLAKLCLKLTQVTIINKRFHACVSIQIKILKTFTFKLGCFTIPPRENDSGDISLVIEEDTDSFIGEDISSMIEKDTHSLIGEDINSGIDAQMNTVIGEQIKAMIEAQIRSVMEAHINSVNGKQINLEIEDQ